MNWLSGFLLEMALHGLVGAASVVVPDAGMALWLRQAGHPRQESRPGGTAAALQGTKTASVQHWHLPPAYYGAMDRSSRLRRASCADEGRRLSAHIERLASRFDGHVGIAVRKAGCRWTLGHNAAQFMPQQSLSRLWVVLAVFDAMDRGRLRLDQHLALMDSDMAVRHRLPGTVIADRGHPLLSVRQLLDQALVAADPAASRRLIQAAGGEQPLRRMLARKQITGIRIAAGKAFSQARVPAMTGEPHLAQARAFELGQYLQAPGDGATPAAMADAVLSLASGQLLSPASTRAMLAMMALMPNGSLRIKALASPGWAITHLTGTGQMLGNLAVGFNDVALLRAPSGDTYALSIMVPQTTAPASARLRLTQDLLRIIATNRKAPMAIASLRQNSRVTARLRQSAARLSSIGRQPAELADALDADGQAQSCSSLTCQAVHRGPQQLCRSDPDPRSGSSSPSSRRVSASHAGPAQQSAARKASSCH